MSKRYFVYILTNKRYGVLYTGITNNLPRRLHEHKNKLISGFSKKYNLTNLVYWEETSDIEVAIQREKQIKGWLRKKKIVLIESKNSNWGDLSKDWFE